MSSENQRDGWHHYATGDKETRAWFERQWAIWPQRADQRYTTNTSFHYGAVQAFRAEHGRDPVMSTGLRSWVAYLDQDDGQETQSQNFN